MAAFNFAQCFALTLKHEGGYVDHPADPGGATNLGVTIGTLSAWLGRPATKAEVRALTPEKVAPIYRRNYWDRIRADELPAGLDFALYDYAVNSGPKRAAIALQRCLDVADDGVIGSVTLASVASRPVDALIGAVNDERLAFLRRLSIWPTFAKGWTARVTQVRVQAARMAATAPVPVPTVVTAPLPPPVFAPAPRKPAGPPQAAAPANPAPAASGFWSRVADRLRTAFPPKKV